MKGFWPSYCRRAGACCAGVALSIAFLLRRVCLAVRPCARACGPAYEGLGGSQGPKGFKINVSEASGAAIRPEGQRPKGFRDQRVGDLCGANPPEVEIPAALATVNTANASEINVWEASGAPIRPSEVEFPPALVAIICATACVLACLPVRERVCARTALARAVPLAHSTHAHVRHA